LVLPVAVPSGANKDLQSKLCSVLNIQTPGKKRLLDAAAKARQHRCPPFGFTQCTAASRPLYNRTGWTAAQGASNPKEIALKTLKKQQKNKDRNK
jgi:hypothetical protein